LPALPTGRQAEGRDKIFVETAKRKNNQSPVRDDIDSVPRHLERIYLKYAKSLEAE